jgi:hypothetical protein
MLAGKLHELSCKPAAYAFWTASCHWHTQIMFVCTSKIINAAAVNTNACDRVWSYTPVLLLLLQVLLFHRHACEALDEDALLELADWAVRKLAHLNSGAAHAYANAPGGPVGHSNEQGRLPFTVHTALT